MTAILSEIIEIARFVLAAAWGILPFFFISIVLSVLVNRLELSGAIRKAFDARVGVAILLATAVGAFSPFCSCSVIPIIAGLLAGGVPLAPVMSFWIASPTMDPEIFALTVGVLGWRLALARLGATLALSLGAGYLTLYLTRHTRLLDTILPGVTPPAAQTCCAAAPAASRPFPLVAPPLPAFAVATGPGNLALPVIQPRPAGPAGWRSALVASFRRIDWNDFARDVLAQSLKLARWMLLAFLLEALMSRYLPQEAIAALLGRGQVLAVPLAALVGIPLYLSNLSALPIVHGLLQAGMQSGAAIAFLIAGPVTTIPAMTAVWGVVRRRVFFLYFGVSLLGATLLGFVVNLLF